MMRIGIEINGVLRDTIGKFTELYEKHLVGSTEFESVDKKYEITFSGDTDEVVEMNEDTSVNWFEYKILSPVTSLNMMNHFAFPSKDELYSLTSQFKRAADSIVLNITEGAGNYSDKEFARFLTYSVRSGF